MEDGEFVDKMLREAEEQLSQREMLARSGWNLEKLADDVCKKTKIKRADLKRKGRSNAISVAKGLIAYWGTEVLGLKSTEVANFLELSQPSISKAVRRGCRHAEEKSVKLLK